MVLVSWHNRRVLARGRPEDVGRLGDPMATRAGLRGRRASASRSYRRWGSRCRGQRPPGEGSHTSQMGCEMVLGKGSIIHPLALCLL